MDAAGTVYVADHDNHRVQVFSAGGTFLRQWGSYGTADGQFQYPTGIAVDGDGYVYVTDRGAFVRKFTNDGTFVTRWGHDDGPPNYAGFVIPTGIEVMPNGDILVCDYWQRELHKYTNTGGFLAKWVYYGASGFYPEMEPHDVAVAANGDIYILDGNPYLPQVIKVNSNGQFLARYWAPTTGNSTGPQASRLTVPGTSMSRILEIAAFRSSAQGAVRST